jgi:hypothetical protein
MRAGRINNDVFAESRLLDVMTKHALRRWGAADVAHANK